MKTLIIGAGEVGKALFEVVKGSHESYIRDMEDFEIDGIEVLHICYPDNDDFENVTKSYIRDYEPKLTIIHSSVPVGTTEKCGDHVIYSPVRGRHPKLASDLKIYKKFIFGNFKSDMQLAADYFANCGIRTQIEKGTASGELLKLLSNIHMGLEIAWRQEIERICSIFETDPFVYEEWEKSYNEGYQVSGDLNLIRPTMKPDPIGGHCIIPCTEILARQYPSLILDFILSSNEQAVEEYAEKNGQMKGVK